MRRVRADKRKESHLNPEIVAIEAVLADIARGAARRGVLDELGKLFEPALEQELRTKFWPLPEHDVPAHPGYAVDALGAV